VIPVPALDPRILALLTLLLGTLVYTRQGKSRKHRDGRA
jgi:hypothetical protein